jgi:hypothetical protein
VRKTIIQAALLLCAMSSHAGEHKARVMPSAGERESPHFVVGSSFDKWITSHVYWHYNPANQPAGLSTEAVVNAIQVAADRWSGMCGVHFHYVGTTTVRPYAGDLPSDVDRRNVIGWEPVQETDTESITLGVTYSWRSTESLVDADIILNTAVGRPWTTDRIDGVMTHEWGHAIGVNHSDTEESVMSATPYNPVPYQRILRGDDAKACAALYGASSNALSNRTFNWAEEAYPEFLSPGPSASGTYEGYYYRYYPNTKSYLGSRNGRVYYMGPAGVIQDVGTLDYYTPWVENWGY